jgi:hypothetical protein
MHHVLRLAAVANERCAAGCGDGSGQKSQDEHTQGRACHAACSQCDARGWACCVFQSPPVTACGCLSGQLAAARRCIFSCHHTSPILWARLRDAVWYWPRHSFFTGATRWPARMQRCSRAPFQIHARCKKTEPHRLIAIMCAGRSADVIQWA